MDQPRIDEPPTQSEIDAARRFGVDVSLYRQFKRNAGPAAQVLETGAGPADIAAEAELHERLRARPGFFKRRNVAPNIFVAAARTPGEVAQTLLTIVCYLVLMLALIAFGGGAVQRIPGVFQVVALGVLLIPAMIMSSFLWGRIGENARNVVRLLVRFWPVTLILLLFAVGLIRVLLG